MSDLDLTNTFGAMYVGAMVSMALYGITTLQTYFYYRHYQKDEWDVKAIVVVTWVLDTVHVVFMCHAMHYYLIIGYGVRATLATGIWSLYASLLINIIGAVISQSFFTVRIHRICPKPWKWPLTIVTSLMVAAHFVFGIDTVVHFFQLKEFSRLGEAEHVAVVPFGTMAILSDIVIALALVILLRRSKTDFDETNNLINTLIVYAVNRCVLTVLVAVVEVVLFLAIPGSLYSFAIDFIIGKLYVNSLLAHLNSRKSLSSANRGSYSGTLTNTQFDVVIPSAGGRANLNANSMDVELSGSMGSTFSPSSLEAEEGTSQSYSNFSSVGDKRLRPQRRKETDDYTS